MKISVKAERDYEVLLDIDYLSQLQRLSKDRKRVAIIFSELMHQQISALDLGDAEVLYCAIPDSESGKSARTLLQVWDWLGAAGFTRSDLIVGIGGGAVTDFAGYAAASWLRGIDWVAVPTTVAGMVDAAVGGKTGINSDYGKNLIGAFHSPISVLVDISWPQTLSDRDFAAGLAEVVKCGFIKDEKILHLLEGRDLASIRGSRDVTIELIQRAIEVKADVVSADFKESFDREVLNYGHTFGHAVELFSSYSMRHGECVSIGMAYIAYLSHELGLISQELLSRHLEVLTRLGLPISYPCNQWPELLGAMRMDKKTRGDVLRFVALSDIGKTQRLENPQESALISAYEKVCL